MILAPEHRRHPRIPLAFPVFRRDGSSGATELGVNLSRGGLALKATAPLEPKVRYALTLASPDGEVAADVQAELAREPADGTGEVGLKFVELGAAAEAAIEELLCHALALPQGQRAVARIPVRLHAMWLPAGRATSRPVELVNLSLGGAQMIAFDRPPIGSAGLLTLEAPGSGWLHSLPAKISWTDRTHAGLQFAPEAAELARPLVEEILLSPAA